MKKNDLEALCSLLEQKAELLEKYDGISIRLLIDDFDKLDHLLDVRHEFLLEFNTLTPKIDEVVAKQTAEEQTLLQSMLRYKALPEAAKPEWVQLQSILSKMKRLIDAINEKTRKTDERFNQYQLELLDQLQVLSKGQKVVQYMGSAGNADLFNGSRMDEKS